MAKFFGEIGFGVKVESAPGVYTYVITELPYYGDVVRDALKFRESDKVNNDLSVRNSISIVADAYASEHAFDMKYIKWQGILWIVSDVEIQSPRLKLSLGGVYNGVTA